MMASDIQIVNISNFEKIQSFLNDSAYKEILENSETFNTRLCIERRLRMPFLDPQTGVAQTHCALFMKAKQRMPGFRSGQIYTYPSTRWRKPKRQYLLHHQSYKAYQFRETHNHHHHHHNNHHSHHHQGENTASSVSVDGNSLGASGDNDSKDGHPIPEKEWYYEEMELPHPEDFEEEIESDMDFEESYSGRKKKRNRNTTKKTTMSGEPTPKRGRKVGSKTRKNLDIDGGGGGGGASNAATGGGAGGGGSSSSSTSNSKRRTSTLPPPSNTSSLPLTNPEEPQMPVLIPEPKIAVEEPESSPKKTNKIRAADRGKAQPSPYCDFCLGDARENKKTNAPEELVSCSDCGRSGHPTCLQFTPNMIISVKRYRWQCIECKYCSICGTSDNDDQLLFCDDCDRGYHMYCLTPPLTTPPEGSWSCQLCMEEFHSGKK